jgi:hypothetical protein
MQTNVVECGPCPVFASFTLAFALQLRKKHGKTSVRVRETLVRLRKTLVKVQYTYCQKHPHITKPSQTHTLQNPLICTLQNNIRILEKAENSMIIGARCYVRFRSVELVKFYTVINFRDEGNGVMKRNLLKNIATGILSLKMQLKQFPCVYKRMLGWFLRLQFATTCFLCSPPDLNFLEP